MTSSRSAHQITASTRLVSAASAIMERRLSRRSLLARLAVAGSAVTTSGLDYVLHPGTAYASICGVEHTCASGWTAMCCTINHGVNQCPPGSFAGGWWKAEGASLCGGKARYYVDCQGECTHCGCHGSHFCAEQCWSCRRGCAHGSCDERRVCHNVFRYGQCERDRHCSGPVLCRAISCTPPWKWADCSTTSATDNFTISHSAPCLARWTPIEQRYTHLGSQASPLGATVDGEHKGRHGHVQRYLRGRMYWTERTGARYLTDRVLHRYVSLGELASPLGPPITDAGPTSDGHGRQARFEHGGIFQGPGREAHGLWDAVWDKWVALDLFRGPLGYPTTDLTHTADHKGRFAHFTNGSIFQGPGLAPHDLFGQIAVKYQLFGAERSPVGYPTADQSLATDGRGVNGFEVICAAGAVAMADGQAPHTVWGPIYSAWDRQGRAAGELGFPISDVVEDDLPDGPGLRCDFEYGYATYDATTDQVTVVLT
jgi:hypothetical protein